VAIRDGQTMGVIEVMPAETFYDYEAKYQRNDTRYVFPAALSPAVQKQVESVAERAYSAVGCRGVARVDVMLSQDESPFVLEVNTIPGMTATSLVPKVAAGIGIAFPDFAVSMLDAATTDARALLIGGAR
jgi:D-alanine-D-alanine ligase